MKFTGAIVSILATSLAATVPVYNATAVALAFNEAAKAHSTTHGGCPGDGGANGNFFETITDTITAIGGVGGEWVEFVGSILNGHGGDHYVNKQ
ncbi:hypothetical protein VHEMI01713 [[Torrubiella] hemipterigena]|uniref:Uncharacterized protein n=1 Tax=[Torrubiella] hemipterigena TaxID=1531966 RepID=A0A0A1SMM8_9HYPO|nr:hypothetical protein VHEMI01713 [[Torrubiella] hemipterigena]